MRAFTNSEKAVRNVADCNGRAALWLYQESFPNRHMPNHKMFQLLHRQLSENGTLIVSIDERGRSKTERQPYIEETNLKLVEKHSTQVQQLRHIPTSQPTVWRMLNKERLHPSNIQSVQTL